MIAKLANFGGAIVLGGVTLGLCYSCYYNVDPGYVSIKFSRFTGLGDM